MTSLGTALGLAVGAGVATFFSPCAYALLPGYVGVYLGVADGESGSLAADGIRGVVAAAGVLVVVGATIVALAAVGEAVEAWIRRLEPVTALALVGFGIALLRGSAVGWHIQLPERRSGLVGFAVFGAVYAVAAVGCVAPLFFGLVLEALRAGTARTVAVVGAYGVTIAALLLATTVAVGAGHELADSRLSRLSVWGQQLGGVVLILAGAVQFVLTV